MAAVWIAAKLFIYLSGYSIEWYNISALINNFLLLSAVAIGLYLTKKQAGFEKVTFLEDVKSAIAGGVIYTVIVASFSWYYLSSVDSSYLDYKIEERMVLVEEELSDDKNLTLFKEQNPDAELKSREQIVEEIRQTTVGILNPKVQFVFLLMGFLLLSVFSFIRYSLNNLVCREVEIRLDLSIFIRI